MDKKPHIQNERCPTCKRMCRALSPNRWHCDRCNQDWGITITKFSNEPDNISTTGYVEQKWFSK